MEIREEEVVVSNFQPKYPHPHYFVPGYAGFCPRYTEKSIGKTFGHATHSVMVELPYVATRLMSLTYKLDDEDNEQEMRLDYKKKIAESENNLRKQLALKERSNIPKPKMLKPTDALKHKQHKHLSDKDMFGDRGDGSNSGCYRAKENKIDFKKHVDSDLRDRVVTTTLKQETSYDYKGKCNGYTETYTVHRWFKNMPSQEHSNSEKKSTSAISYKKKPSSSSSTLLANKNSDADSFKAYNNSICRLRQIKKEMQESQLFKS